MLHTYGCRHSVRHRRDSCPFWPLPVQNKYLRFILMSKRPHNLTVAFMNLFSAFLQIEVFLFHSCVCTECTVETHSLNTEGEGNDLSLWNACRMFPVSCILNISQLRSILPGLCEDDLDKEKSKISCYILTMQKYIHSRVIDSCNT